MGNSFKLEKIFDFFNYVFWFFLLNIFFMVLNTPLILFLLFVGIDNVTTYLPLFLLCLVPFGPSFITLLHCMDKLVLFKDLDLFSDIISGFKTNVKQSSLLWCCELLIIFILSSNIKLFSQLSFGLIPTCLFVSLLIVVLISIPYLLILINKFSMANIDILKASIVLGVTRPIISLGNIAIFLFALVLFEISAGTTVLFISSICAYLLVQNTKGLLMALQA